MGPFEEEEEGTGVASDVVKVQGEAGHPRSPDSRNDPGTVTIPQYQFNKTKQHTQDNDVHTESKIYYFEQLDTRSRFRL